MVILSMTTTIQSIRDGYTEISLQESRAKSSKQQESFFLGLGHRANRVDVRTAGITQAMVSEVSKPIRRGKKSAHFQQRRKSPRIISGICVCQKKLLRIKVRCIGMLAEV
jgi:hypothetical protein